MELEQEKRKRGQGSVFKKKNSSKYYIRYYAPNSTGKQVQREESTGTDDPVVAEKILRERLVDTSRGAKAHADVKQLRYEDIRNPYLQDNPEVAVNEKAKLAHLDEFFGDKKLTRILEADLIRKYIEKRGEGENGEDGVAGPTIKRELNILRAMYYLAQKERKLGSLDIPYFPMPADSAPRKGFLAPDQFEKLKDALPEIIRPTVIFMYDTGCRKGAAKKITWDMVNEDCTEIELPGSITKSGEALTLPLSDELTAVLKEKAKPQEVTENGKVYSFPRRVGPVFSFRNFRVAWNRACHKVGLGVYEKRLYKGLMPHDLRRSAVRNMIRAGVDQSVAMEISGHKTDSIFKRYNITDTTDIREAMTKVKQYTNEAIRNAKKA